MTLPDPPAALKQRIDDYFNAQGTLLQDCEVWLFDQIEQATGVRPTSIQLEAWEGDSESCFQIVDAECGDLDFEDILLALYADVVAAARSRSTERDYLVNVAEDAWYEDRFANPALETIYQFAKDGSDKHGFYTVRDHKAVTQ